MEDKKTSMPIMPIPTLAVGAVVWKNDQVLLVRRAKPPRVGEWSLPGGHLEPGETTRAGVAREIGEETGVEVLVGDLIEVVDARISAGPGEPDRHFVLIDFRCDWLCGEPQAASDATDVCWANIEDCKRLVTWSETLRIIEKSK